MPHLTRCSRALRLLALGVTLPLTSCGPAASGEVDTPADSGGSVSGVTRLASADSLRLQLEVPREVAAGTAMPIVLRATNVAGRPLELYLRGREATFDVEAARPDGTVIWRRLADEVIPAIIQLRELAPGDTFSLHATWDQRADDGRPVAPGDYTLRGLLLVEGPEPLATPRVPLRITRR